MFYFIAQDENGSNNLYESKVGVKEMEFVVVADYDNRPMIAQVTKRLSKYQALATYNEKPLPIINLVDMKEFLQNQEKEVEKKVLVDRMEDKIKEIQMLEKLEKYAGKDSEMLELLNQYKNGEEITIDEF